MINKDIIKEFASLKKREQEILNSLSVGDTIDLYFEMTERGIAI